MIQPYQRPDPQELVIRRLMQRVTDAQRQDPKLETKFRLYVKIGGERLARHYIESIQLCFGEPFEIAKRRSDEGEIEESETPDGNDGSDAEEDDH